MMKSYIIKTIEFHHTAKEILDFLTQYQTAIQCQIAVFHLHLQKNSKLLKYFSRNLQIEIQIDLHNTNCKITKSSWAKIKHIISNKGEIISYETKERRMLDRETSQVYSLLIKNSSIILIDVKCLLHLLVIFIFSRVKIKG